MRLPPPRMEIQIWHIDRLVFYARNPRNNGAAVDRMCASIREFGFNIPLLARNGEVVDGHLRLKAARQTRVLASRSVPWADWDEDLLSRFARVEREPAFFRTPLRVNFRMPAIRSPRFRRHPSALRVVNCGS